MSGIPLRGRGTARRWKRIGIVVLVWGVLVCLGELAFIGWYRMDGSGRFDYGETFARESYIRAHTDRPCIFNGGLACTQDQVAAYHRATTVDFWLDVRDNSVPVLLRALMLLGIAILCVIAWEVWQRRRHAARQIRR